MKTGEVHLDLEDYGVGLVYRNGDDNGWDRPAGAVIPIGKAHECALFVEMNHDDGSWTAAFSVIGFTDSGEQVVLLQKTNYVRFHSGHSDAFAFGFTFANSAREAARRSKEEHPGLSSKSRQTKSKKE